MFFSQFCNYFKRCFTVGELGGVDGGCGIQSVLAGDLRRKKIGI